MKKAFTLIEVNLAILVMAGGILSIVGLYSLGFRENRQSSEDVASAAYADAVISPLVMAISATNLKWSVFKDMPSYPGEDGWRQYFDNDGLVTDDPTDKAKGVFNSVMEKMRGAAEGSLEVNAEWPDSASGNLKAGLVVLHDERSPAIVKIAFRAPKQSAMLLSSPLYYTEVRFQGLPEK